MTRKLILTIVLLLTAGVVSAWAASFEHKAHLEEYLPGESCETCHVPDAISIVPDTKVCLDCHDQATVDQVTLGQTNTHGPVWSLNHRAEALGAGANCASCHAQEDCLECHKAGFADEMGELGNNMINVHRSDFDITHPIPARTDQQLCSRCHESRFCSDCHDDWRFRTSDIGSPSHRRTFDLGFEDADFEAIHGPIRAIDPSDASQMCDNCHLGTSVAPDFHSWSVGHAREARRSLATCQACHPDGDVCLRCHSARAGASAFNPHGDDWDDIKGNLEDANNGKTCRKCH